MHSKLRSSAKAFFSPKCTKYLLVAGLYRDLLLREGEGKMQREGKERE